jgi:hypothetical protein
VYINKLIFNKIILYIVFGFTLLLGFGSYVSADIQPWSMPTDRVCEVVQCPQLNVIDNNDVVVLIKKKCDNYDVDCSLALKIVKAESNYKNVPNFLYTNEKGKYTAYGIFQITRTTYKAFCGDPKERMDIEKNIDCGLKIMQDSGVQHWSESKRNWNKPTENT